MGAAGAVRIFTGICKDKGILVLLTTVYPPLRPSYPLAFALTLPRFPFSSEVFTVLLFSTLV